MSNSDRPNDDVWNDLVERHLRGELSQSEQEQLAGWLDSDAALREDFVRKATWDTELTEVVRTGGEGRSEARQELRATMENVAESRDDFRYEKKSRQPAKLMRTLLAVAATSILVLSYALIKQDTAPETIVTDPSSGSVARITGLSGSLIWTGDRGELVRDIRVGTELAGGTIEGLSPDSWFELQFNDGSEVTISGASMLTFSDDGQKRLRLREGRMSADVAPQPDGNPMVIQTRTATLTVLGTSFDVEAELPATAVSVREGTVRVTRTSDGKEIDVSANHRVVASADQEFERKQIADVVRNWESRIDQGSDETFGKWIAATETSPALLSAVAFVPMENRNVVLYLLGLGVRSDEGAPIEVDEDSRFEIHGKIDVETEIYFGIQVTYPNGDFAGKFLAKCTVQRDNSGNFVARADLPDFGLDPSVAEYKDKLAPSPQGLFVNGVWSFTHSKTPSGLRVSEVKLDSSEPE